MSRLGRIRRRSPGHYPRVAAAACLLLTVRVAVVALPFAKLRRALLRAADASRRVVPGEPIPAAVVQAVEIADRALPGDRSCLVRSLSAETLLRLYGVVPVHRIGVDPEDDLEAHSWLELDDEVLIGDLEDLARYEPLPALEDADPT